MYLKGLAILSALLVVARAVHDATPFGADGDASTPRKAMTVYTTVYATSVATETTTVERICAVQVNVTQVCRRRRDKWIDEPSVLTFDGDLDKVDLMIDPSRTETMETTVVPDLAEAMMSDEAGPPAPTSDIAVESSTGDVLEAVEARKFIVFVKTLLTRTSSKTSTSTLTVTTSKSFFVLGCTPSPFPYPVC